METAAKPIPLVRMLVKIAILIAFTTLCACVAAGVFHFVIQGMLTYSAASIGRPDPDAPRVIDAADTVFIEEMTWKEVRDAKKSGKNRVIVASGGVEQCGEYLAMGKHNYVCRATTDVIARKLGDALIAPIIAFVPQGDIDPPTSHMLYAGTVSLTEDTYRRLLIDICECYRVQGFEQIILIADSWGNQAGMKDVAQELSARWAGGKTRIWYIPEYHDSGDSAVAWLHDQHGIKEVPEWIHDNFAVTATIMTVDPTKVRLKERIAAGKDRINGINLSPPENTIAWGKRIIDYRADITVAAIRKASGVESRIATPEEKP